MTKSMPSCSALTWPVNSSGSLRRTSRPPGKSSWRSGRTGPWPTVCPNSFSARSSTFCNSLEITRTAQTSLKKMRNAVRVWKPIYSPGLFALAQVADTVEQDRKDDGAADEGALPEGIDAQQAEAVADDLDQRGADQGAERRADAAGQIGAADDCRGDHLQFHARPDVRGHGAEPAGLDDAGDAGREGGDDIDRHLDRAHRDAGQGRR